VSLPGVNLDFDDFVPRRSIRSIEASVCAWNESCVARRDFL
jgi:hypothetical protein